MKKYKSYLNNELWNKDINYFHWQEINLNQLNDNYFYRRIKDISSRCNRVLDCGCGSGTKLKYIIRNTGFFYGIDISKLGIRVARRRIKNKNAHLSVMDMEQLKFKDNYFDLTYSTYVLEHADNPEKIILEMVRVTKQGGIIILLAPNFGSPLNYSLTALLSKDTVLKSALIRFFKSHLYIFKKPNDLDWEKFEPKFAKCKQFEGDWDAVTAPYLQTTIYFLNNQGVQIVEFSSGVEKSKFNGKFTLYLYLLKVAKWVLNKLGQYNINPYKYYGETLFVVGIKK